MHDPRPISRAREPFAWARRGPSSTPATTARNAVDAAARDLPDTWIAAATTADKVRVGSTPAGKGYLGTYTPRIRGKNKTPEIATNATPGNALHEYVHHIQAAMPDIDRLFQNLHARRNHGIAPAPLKSYRGLGRNDEYIDAYFGREYHATSLKKLGYDTGCPALEVVTRAFQITFHQITATRPDGTREILDIASLARDDPELLDLVLGTLFHYNP